MRWEIVLVRDLLRDAIAKLTAGFMNIGGLMRESALDPRLVAQVNREVAAIVTALQFQDMLDQLLNHTLGRLHAIEAEVRVVAAAPATGAKGARLSARPVAQRHPDPGDVELF